MRSQNYGPAHPINHRTGELEAYITGSPHLLEVTPYGASLTMPGTEPTGELKRKVRVAQAGDPGSATNGLTPPRPVIGVNEKDLLFVLTSMQSFIERAVSF